MPRHFHLVNHLTIDQVRAQERASTTSTATRRWQLVRLVMCGQTVRDASALVGYHERYAHMLLHAYNDVGPSALAQRPRNVTERRRPQRLLDEAQMKQLALALGGPAPDGGLWTGPKVARWIASVTGREKVCPQRGWVYLKRLGFVLRRPRPRHAKADAERQEAFKKSPSRRWQSG